MLPVYQVITGVKGLDISQPELSSQQNNAPANNPPPITTFPSRVPAAFAKTNRTKPVMCCSPLFVAQNSPHGGPISNAASPHSSASTSKDIDVEVSPLSSSQTQAYDLTVRHTSPINSYAGNSHNGNQPSVSSGFNAPPIHTVRTYGFIAITNFFVIWSLLTLEY
ncbi:hypothetical protein COOONC_00208 [Cooperia oncophora]